MTNIAEVWVPSWETKGPATNYKVRVVGADGTEKTCERSYKDFQELRSKLKQICQLGTFDASFPPVRGRFETKTEAFKDGRRIQLERWLKILLTTLLDAADDGVYGKQKCCGPPPPTKADLVKVYVAFVAGEEVLDNRKKPARGLATQLPNDLAPFMLTPDAAKAKQLHDLINNHPTEGIRHIYLAATDELSYQCQTMNLNRDLLQNLKEKSTAEFATELDTLFSAKSIYFAQVGPSSTQVFPYLKHADPTSSKGMREWSKLKDKVVRLERTSVEELFGGWALDKSELKAEVIKQGQSQLGSILPANAKPASKPALFLTSSIGCCIGDKDSFNLAELPADGEDDMAGAVAKMEADGCVPYNAGPKRREATQGEKENNVAMMYLLRTMMQPFFDPVIILNHNVHGKDTGKAKASYNFKWRASMAQDMMVAEPSLANGMVIVDYAGGQNSGGATLFEAGGPLDGKELKMESFVIDKKLHPFIDQQELLGSESSAFEKHIDSIKTKLLAYHNETGLPVQCVSTGPMRASWFDAMASGAEDILTGGDFAYGGASAAEEKASPLHS